MSKAEDAAREIERQARSAILSGFASPRLTNLLANQGGGIADVLIEDTSGFSHSLLQMRRSGARGSPYRLTVLDEFFVSWLTILYHGPKSLLDEVRAAGERAKKATCGGIRAVRFVTTDGGEHLLSARRQSDDDKPFGIMLMPLWSAVEDLATSACDDQPGPSPEVEPRR